MRPSRYIECENATDELRMCVRSSFMGIYTFIQAYRRKCPNVITVRGVLNWLRLPKIIIIYIRIRERNISTIGRHFGYVVVFLRSSQLSFGSCHQQFQNGLHTGVEVIGGDGLGDGDPTERGEVESRPELQPPSDTDGETDIRGLI